MNNRSLSLSQFLQSAGLSLPEALCLLLTMAEERESVFPGTGLSVTEEMRLYRKALKAEKEARASVTLQTAISRHLSDKQELKHRSRQEMNGIFRRIIRRNPDLLHRKMSELTQEDCYALVERSYGGARSRNKVNTYLRGLFSYAAAHGWCRRNLMKNIPKIRIQEKRIVALSLLQVKQLLSTLRQPRHLCCGAAVYLMLWCGVRPNEVRRLHWGDIDLEGGWIYLEPKHTKTGGARRLTIQPVLRRHLLLWQQCMREGNASGAPLVFTENTRITPPDWNRKWYRLRQDAGLNPWREDTLRHTFASYHLSRFRNKDILRQEMGHCGEQLLNYRYINLRGITHATAAEFWTLRT